MPKKLSDLIVLFCDQGLFIEIACKLAQTYKKVYYFCPGWTSAFPKMNNTMIGTGMPGIEVVSSIFGDHFDEIDLFVFPDCNFGPEQVHLRSLNKPVWGAGMGEDLELDRVLMKEIMRERGLPVGAYRTVKGMAALREHLKAHKNQHVKVSRFRGTFETFKSEDYKLVEPKLDEVEHNLGALKHDIELVVEDDLPNRFEVGEDMYCIDGQYPSQILVGPEIKDRGLVGIFKKRAELPEAMLRFDRAIAPTLKRYGWRGFLSTEIRVGKDGIGYMIDLCSRAASPPSELYTEFYTNLADIIWQGANGVLVDPAPIAKYGAEALIHSSWADQHWQPLDIPDELKRNVKLRNAMRIKGRYYVAPQAVGLPEIGAVVGWGNTMEEAVAMVKKIADEVKGYYIEVTVDCFDKAEEEIAQAQKYGINIFP